MSNPRIKVTGFKTIIANVKELEAKIGRGAMREAMTKAARLMTAKAKQNAPKGATGLLKKSIRQKATTSKKGVVTVYVGPSTKVSGQVDRFGTGDIKTVRPVKYAHLVEFGTAARGSYGRKGAAVSPGNPPKPFMRPAFESTKEAVGKKYKEEMIPAIQRAAARIKKRNFKSVT